MLEPLDLWELSFCYTYRDRDSPSLINRLKVSQYNQLGVPSPGSQTSTPAEQEVDEMVSQMSDQVREGWREGGVEGWREGGVEGGRG